MTARPIVSIAIASYNAGAFLEAAVMSALAQEGVDVDILIVDDRSTDGSDAIGRELEARIPQVRFAQLAANGGPGAARNHAIDLARGQWIAVLDSDDLMELGRLARLVAHGEATGADIVADDLMLFENGPPPRDLGPFLGDKARTGPLTLEDYLRSTIMYDDVPDLGYLKPIIRLDRLRAAGVRYDERLRIAEDDNLVLRLLLAGLRYELVAVPGYRYRKHGASISHRLSVATVSAMRQVGEELLPLLQSQSTEARALYGKRYAMLGRVLAFEHLIAALKARRPIAALCVAIRNPAMLPLLRMPLRARFDRLFGRA